MTTYDTIQEARQCICNEPARVHDEIVLIHTLCADREDIGEAAKDCEEEESR